VFKKLNETETPYFWWKNQKQMNKLTVTTGLKKSNEAITLFRIEMETKENLRKYNSTPKKPTSQ
jgi:hypothetical protein